jgi:hypothetical protein
MWLPVLQGPEIVFLLNSHYKMEMISQETVGESICDSRNVFLIELHEIEIVFFFDEDIFTIIPPVIDVINFPEF